MPPDLDFVAMEAAQKELAPKQRLGALELHPLTQSDSDLVRVQLMTNRQRPAYPREGARRRQERFRSARAQQAGVPDSPVQKRIHRC